MKFPKPKKGKKVRRKKLITLSRLIKLAQIKVDAYVRGRDSKEDYFTCISCGKQKHIVKMNAGHYVPVSKSSFLRFNEWNINGECEGCNCFDEFHLIGYRKNLIEKIGLQSVELLEKQKDEVKLYKWKREDLEKIISEYSL